MELRSEGISPSKMNQDLGKSRFSPDTYYDAQHIRFTSVDGTSKGLITNEKGNELRLDIPTVEINRGDRTIKYGKFRSKYEVSFKRSATELFNLGNLTLEDNIIIGHIVTKDGFVLFVTNPMQSIDMIFEIGDLRTLQDNQYRLNLLYVGKLGFSQHYPISGIFNYENENIQKVYWVDGLSQIRSLNLRHDSIEGNSPLLSLPASSFNFVGSVSMKQPYIKEIRYGGNHTSGVIQYAYNLYNLNGSETKISPLTDLIPLGKGDNLGGGDVNEVVGASPVVRVEGLDKKYDYIKLYSVKYTAKDQLPRVDLILDSKITGTITEHQDDGRVIETIPLEEFIFIGSEPTVAKHVISKDKRLIASNIKETSFEVPEELDCRCYSYSLNGVAKVLATGDNWSSGPLGGFASSTTDSSEITIPNDYTLAPDHNAINANYNVYKYSKDGVYGGEGKYFKYNIVRKNARDLEYKQNDYKFFKDNEIYRIGIVFRNELGQETTPKWIADFKTPEGNLEGLYNTLSVEAKPSLSEFIKNYRWKNSYDIPTGFSIVRAERGNMDKTILYSGILTDFIIQTPQSTESDDEISQSFNQFEDVLTKIPTWLARNYAPYPYVEGDPRHGDIKKGAILKRTQHGSGLVSEVFNEGSSDYKRQYSWMHNKMMQLYSPELLFNNDAVNLPNGLKLRVKGVVNLNPREVYYWGQIRDTETLEVLIQGKMQGTLSPHIKTQVSDSLPNGGVLESKDTDVGIIRGYPSVKLLHNMISYHSRTYGRHAFIMPTVDEGTMLFDQYYRNFDEFLPAHLKQVYDIYGKPEFTIRGKNIHNYNNDARYRYTNSLESIMSDSDSQQDHHPTIVSVNSYNNNNLTLVLGKQTDATKDRIGLRELYQFTGLSAQQNFGLIYAEITRDEEDLYTGNMYGGNSFEAKKRTTYVKIGDYIPIRINPNGDAIIDKYVNNSPGDTFVQNFKFARITKTDSEIYNENTQQITELINYPTETTVDLRNRNDISFGSWDSRWQPRDEEFHKYNSVYSQQSNLLKISDLDHTFRKVNNFETRLIPSNLKYPNEVTDSWTRFLVNDTLDLDGSYGPINNLSLFNDSLFTFQDSAISNISVNPRVQIATEDGIGLQLGSGGILPEYKYLTTTSGSLNKFGVVSGKRGIYYYDALNSSIGRIPDESSYMLSEAKGIQSLINKHKDVRSLSKDNPIDLNGAVFGADLVNNDIYMTLLINPLSIAQTQGEDSVDNLKSLTLVYNEETDSFIDTKTYYPTRYINTNGKLIMSADNKLLYESNAGEYNNYFGNYSPSFITLLLNPDVHVDKIFTNIFYNSEVYLDDLEQPELSLSHIQAWNEYQDSGRIPLVIGRSSNLKRKFRNWYADIPRDGRNRIRNPWIFLKLEFNHDVGYKLVLHDIVVSYIV